MFVSGCQPAKPRIKSNVGTTSTTTEFADDHVPKAEIKDDKPDRRQAGNEKASDKATNDKPVLPKGKSPPKAIPTA